MKIRKTKNTRALTLVCPRGQTTTTTTIIFSIFYHHVQWCNLSANHKVAVVPPLLLLTCLLWLASLFTQIFSKCTVNWWWAAVPPVSLTYWHRSLSMIRAAVPPIGIYFSTRLNLGWTAVSPILLHVHTTAHNLIARTSRGWAAVPPVLHARSSFWLYRMKNISPAAVMGTRIVLLFYCWGPDIPDSPDIAST